MDNRKNLKSRIQTVADLAYDQTFPATSASFSLKQVASAY